MTPGPLTFPSEAEMKANLLLDNRESCARLNANLVTFYANTHQSLVTSVTSGQRDIKTITWPLPPKSFVPVEVDGWPIGQEQTGPLVCEALPIPTPPPPAVDPTKVFTCTADNGARLIFAPAGDTTPSGTVISFRGALWIKRITTSFLGTSSYYEELPRS
jgi:hypothetical protein